MGWWSYPLSSQALTHVEVELGCENKMTPLSGVGVYLLVNIVGKYNFMIYGYCYKKGVPPNSVLQETKQFFFFKVPTVLFKLRSLSKAIEPFAHQF